VRECAPGDGGERWFGDSVVVDFDVAKISLCEENVGRCADVLSISLEFI
jgi:hypothetical protein